ncbi:SMP-30/gluconolactonase/LRE family protein [Sphingomonas lenta]|uniref:Gluconolaconase n=1 Tax=Sphingomonas lenta TaxID=1141887 RepID=A0A2A2SBW8_9SPHN|nr:SMP-30/gluconolactonase/LRE family protein [Sphingomonas lenta]PAX06749.1 gluconolaconase [Sphingomonas lenta]
MKRMAAEHAATVGATLGEGPVWDARDGALWFVDIKAPRVHCFDSATARLDAWEAPAEIGWVLPAEDGAFLAGLRTGLHRFTPADGRFDLLAEVEPQLPGNRLNDAAVDPAGRVWFGSMDNAETAATGRLYALERGNIRDSGAEPVVITNGPAIAPDGQTLYAVDTLGRAVHAYDLAEDGALRNRRVFLRFDEEHGHPDGAICDAEGGVWIGFFGGWAARRYDAAGRPTHEVSFPVANVTKLSLGGPDGMTAYATTARKGLDAVALAAQPLAGDLFTFRTDAPGVVAPRISLEAFAR